MQYKLLLFYEFKKKNKNVSIESQSPVCLDHSVEPPPDPVTAPIKPGVESTIEINKDKVGLGLSIVGGSDTLLVIIIYK